MTVPLSAGGLVPAKKRLPSTTTYKVKLRAQSIRGRSQIGASVPEAAWVRRAIELGGADPGYRFDDPRKKYRVGYIGSTRTACYFEVLQQFRSHQYTVDQLRIRIGSGVLFKHPPGELPAAWLADREIVEVSYAPGGECVDVLEPATHSWLNQLASILIILRRYRSSVEAQPQVDVATVLQTGTGARVITQKISSVIHDDPSNYGVRYVSHLMNQRGMLGGVS